MLLIGTISISAIAKAKIDSTGPPVIRRVSDNQEVKVGDVFSQLTIVRDPNGAIHCVFDRTSTEISVETFANQEGGVTLEIGEDCVLRVAAIDAYPDANDPQSIVVPSKVGEK